MKSNKVEMTEAARIDEAELELILEAIHAGIQAAKEADRMLTENLQRILDDLCCRPEEEKKGRGDFIP